MKQTEHRDGVLAPAGSRANVSGLNDLLSRLQAAPVDRSLDGFEAEVLRALARRRQAGRMATALRPVCLASILVALVIGLAMGGIAARDVDPAGTTRSVFGGAAELAPSTLLEGRL